MTLFTNRRRFLQSGAALGAALAMPSLARAQDKRELVIVSFAGQLQEPHQWLARQMEAKHPGLTIRLVPSESQDVVAQIKASQGYSPYDAMPNGEPPHLIAIRDSYILPLDPAAVPNATKAVPAFVAKSKGYGIPASYSLIGIAYNTALVKTPPTAWKDLWDPQYKGQIGIPRASSNLGLGFLVAAAKTFGGSETDLTVGWEKLKELNPKVGRSPSQLLQMLEREEIVMAPIWNNDAAGAADKGLPIAFVKPAPGPIAVISFMSAVKGTRYPELVNEWMNAILSPEYQQKAAGAPYYFGPTIEGVEVPEAARAYTPATPEEVAALQTVDWSAIAAKRGAIVEEFDRLFAS
ncbi:putative spermidine/putrescine transport system substrate-binding protein [Angulomicrobium tetraedrale]|uniref:Putative spermidine/putrescine transport system substrate-binding protein n=1 Tax=Ancylobacter tetraedralis TaxID=217068 RepID=A0A839Z6Z7_9HYPH|nr:extracellular solute-binding protein [Ancylobacter tetraedralis]MBB3770380.1 putative spermidine/putrescine transport system substrate-binding protein [Ancylobacter tetraedralis]